MKRMIFFGLPISFVSMFFLYVSAERVSAAETVIVKENIQKLIKNNRCKGCDLSGANLTRFDLAGADLEGADLSQAKFYLANLSRANLKNANLSGAIFGGTDLGEADLRGADLRGALLESAYLAGALLDGEFIKAKPYESIGVAEIEKVVYVDDQSKPKKTPDVREVSVATRRDFEDPPPPVKTAYTEKKSIPDVKIPKNIPIPQSPPVKKLKPFNKVVVEEKISPEVLLASSVNTSDATSEEQTELVSSAKSRAKKSDSMQNTTLETPEVSPSVISSLDTKEIVEVDNSTSVVAKMGADLANDKGKNDNLNRLLDKNKCYGCDLSGLDLSGLDLENADLEKVDFTDCNLEETNLEGANLKGALLVRANLQRANLKKADLYKADLTGADLTGVDLQDASLDSTKNDGAVW